MIPLPYVKTATAVNDIKSMTEMSNIRKRTGFKEKVLIALVNPLSRSRYNLQ